MTALPPLRGDALWYFRYAKVYARRGFYSGHFGERDPLFIALLHYWCRCDAWTHLAVRRFTLALSWLLALATGLFIAKLADNSLLGVFACALMLWHPAWRKEAVRGLRTELLTLEILAVLAIALWSGNPLWLGLSLGLMALTQYKMAAHTMVPVVCILPSPATLGGLFIAILLMNVIYAPHAYALAKRRGASWAEQRTARYFANLEFRYQECKAKAGYAFYDGAPLSWWDYYVRLHDRRTLVCGYLRGWLESSVYLMLSLLPDVEEAVRSTVKDGTKDFYLLLTWGWPLIAVTLYGAWLAPWWVPALMLWGNTYIAFIYSRHAIEPFRHTARMYPLYLYCLLIGAYGIVSY